ncbi:MAG: GAF domain-containing protein, partial [Nitrospinota bacterium]
MLDQQIQVLLIEDNPGDVRLIRGMLGQVGGNSFRLRVADRLFEGLGVLARNEIDVLMLDLGLPDAEGLDTLLRVQREGTRVPVIVLTRLEDEGLAVKAMRVGAQDYLIKGQLDTRTLVRSIRHAMECAQTLEALQKSEGLARMHAERLAVLQDLSRPISSQQDLEGVLTSIVQGAVKLLEGDRSRLFLLSPDGKNLESKASFGAIPDPPGGVPALPVQGTLAGAAAVGRKPLFVSDVQQDARWRELDWARKQGVHAYIVAPLVLHAEVAGVLSCLSRNPNKFDESDIHLMEALAAHAAIALANARGFDEVRRKSAQIAKLNEINCNLSSTLDLDELLENIFGNAKQLIEGLRVGVWLLNREGRTLIPYRHAFAGPKSHERPPSNLLKVGQTLTGWVAKHREILAVPEARRDPRWEELPWDQGKSFGGYAGIPLLAGDELLGVLSCFAEKPHDWTHDELDLLKSFAAQAAVAIHNARLHEDLGSSEERYRTLFEQARDGIEITDEAGRLVDCNQKVCELLGYTREDLVGMPLSEIVAPEFRDSVPERLARIERQGMEPFESAELRKDGTSVPVEVSAGTMNVRGEKCVIHFVRDITERKNAEKALRESEERFRRLSEAGFEGIGLTEDGRILDVNEKLARMLGYEPNDLIGMDV